MEVYTIILGWVLLCSILQKVNIQLTPSKVVNGRAVYLSFAFFAIWFIMAFRAPTVGADTFQYTSYFYTIASSNSLSDAISIEFISGKIFKAMSYILGFISTSQQFYILWTSSIIVLGMAFFIYRTSKWVVTSTFLFLTFNLFFTSMNISRQWMAIVIMLNAIVFLYKDIKSKWGWLLVIVGFSIHNAVIAFFPTLIGMYIVKKFGLSKKVCVITIFATLLFIGTFAVASGIFSTYFPHYETYVNGTSRDNLIDDTGGGKIIIYYIIFFFVLLTYYISEKNNINNKPHKTFVDSIMPGAIFCTFLGICFFKNNMVNRMLFPYYCLYLIIIPYTFSRFSKRIQFLLYVFMGIGMICSYYFWLMGNLSNVLPYRFGGWDEF